MNIKLECGFALERKKDQMVEGIRKGWICNGIENGIDDIGPFEVKSVNCGSNWKNNRRQ